MFRGFYMLIFTSPQTDFSRVQKGIYVRISSISALNFFCGYAFERSVRKLCFIGTTKSERNIPYT
jgi:hypothetical protein